jgi:hypothetical protein
MGGKQKLAQAQSQANAIAAQTARQQAKASRQSNRVAVRSAKQDRRAGAAQSAALIAAEKESAAALAALDQNQNVETQYIEDEDAMRRKMGGAGRSSYNFGRPLSNLLGGGKSMLG